MANHLPMPPYDELSGHLKYDPCTGLGTWLVSRRNQTRAGTTAGSISSTGYILIIFKSKSYKAHHLSWFLQTGHDPGQLTIDHIDQNKLNNKFSNLRLATKSQQQHNRSDRLDNKSGHRGVIWQKSRQMYEAYISINGKQIHLGRYKTFEQAVAARQAKEFELHGEFSPLHQTNNDQRLILDNNNQQLSLLRHSSL